MLAPATTTLHVSTSYNHTTCWHQLQPHYMLAPATTTLHVGTSYNHTTCWHQLQPHYMLAPATTTLHVGTSYNHTTCWHQLQPQYRVFLQEKCLNYPPDCVGGSLKPLIAWAVTGLYPL